MLLLLFHFGSLVIFYWEFIVELHFISSCSPKRSWPHGPESSAENQTEVQQIHPLFKNPLITFRVIHSQHALGGRRENTRSRSAVHPSSNTNIHIHTHIHTEESFTVSRSAEKLQTLHAWIKSHLEQIQSCILQVETLPPWLSSALCR